MAHSPEPLGSLEAAPTAGSDGRLALYTIGHSNHPIDKFVALLIQHEVTLLVDVRSVPYSHFMVHFRRAALEDLLPRIGIRYHYLGRELGGRPAGGHLVSADGRPDYTRMAQLPPFRHALDTLCQLAAEHRTAIMCAEEDPLQCHRRNLVADALRDRAVRILHIRKYGDAEEEHWDAPGQLPLLDEHGKPVATHKPRARRAAPRLAHWSSSQPN